MGLYDQNQRIIENLSFLAEQTSSQQFSWSWLASQCLWSL